MQELEFQNLNVERSGHIATVTFNRPAKANALNYAHLAEIEAAAQSFRDDVETRVVIFTGAGKHFSSGADLSDPGSAKPAPLSLKRRRARLGARALQALWDIDQITIAAWNGAAMGGGACIATALDFRIGATDCFMQYPEVDIGVNLMWQSLPLIVHLAGPARAKRLVAGGERISAAIGSAPSGSRPQPGSSSTIALIVSANVSRANGARPVSISNSRQPNDHTSVCLSIVWPRICSGLM